MRDLQLWRLLHQDTIPAAEIVPLLEQLAARPPEERLSFFGPLSRALEHTEATVRAAAASVLAGAAGILAFRHLVTLLGDSDPAVRQAALEALRVSAVVEPERWVHALFHPLDEVRRAALDPDRPMPMGPWNALYLLPDPACADRVLTHLGDQSLPAFLLPLLFDYLARGLITRPLCRRLITSMTWPEIYDQLSHGPFHMPASEADPFLDGVLAAAGAEELPVVSGEDPLDELFHLFFEPEAADEPSASATAPHKRFFDVLGSYMLGMPTAGQLRVVTSLILTGARTGCWPEGAAQVCAVFFPGFLRAAWVPHWVRYQAIKGLYALGQRCPRRPDEEIHQLILSPLCRRTSGNLDLWAIGGILHLAQKQPYKLLQGWVSLKEILRAFQEDMEYALPFLGLPDNSDGGIEFLIEQLLRTRSPGGALLPALLTYASPADRLGFLEAVPAEEAVAVFLEIRRLALYRGLALSQNKKQKVAEYLGERVAGDGLEPFLKAWLALPAPEETELGLLLLAQAARWTAPAQLLLVALALDLPLLKKLLHVIAWCAGFPYEKEVKLAKALRGHGDPEVRAWAEDRLPVGSVKPPVAGAPRKKVQRLKRDAAREIASCPEADLPAALANCLAEPVLGLCAALSDRPAPLGPRVDVCTALLASHDPLDKVAEQLARFGADDAGFVERLDKMMVRAWRGQPGLGLAGHAWLFRWEEHCYAFAAQLGELPDGLLSLLGLAQGLVASALRRRLWEAAARLVGLWRWHDQAAFARLCCQAVTTFLVEELVGEQGEAAAQMLLTFHESATAPALLVEVRNLVLAKLPDLPEGVRSLLHWWVDATGLPGPVVRPRPVPNPGREETLALVRASDNLRQLAAWCAGGDILVAEEAALRLVEMGEAGADKLGGLLRRVPPLPASRALAATVSLWPDGPARRGLEALVLGEAAWPESRFLVGLELLTLEGELVNSPSAILSAVLDTACRETDPAWFTPEDWRRLADQNVSELELALRLAGSAQPHAYGLAVRHLTETPVPYGPQVRQALLTFLEAGTGRWAGLRAQAALALQRYGDYSAFPILVHQAVRIADVSPPLLERAPAPLIEELVTGFLTAGPRLADEHRLLSLLDDILAAPEALEDAYSRLLAESPSEQVKLEVINRMGHRSSRARKLRRVAEAFAWGIHAGRELTGRLFAVQMIAGHGLGYTPFEEDRLYITPLPILRGERHGRHVVEGLLLHELGHHVYHRGPEKQAVWKEASDQGLHPLFNLVADEHLERNLRGRDEEHGDRLKKLVAYAFQHSVREVAVGQLLGCLQGRAFAVLTTARLGVARTPGCVVIEGGRVLLEMEKAGLSFARFVRALRMGLGNRHHDPKVAEALALFRRQFRGSSMSDLLAIARRLREIFGWETGILDAFGQDQLLGAGEGDLLCHGEGLSDDELQSEIRRVLNPGPRREGSTSGGPPGPRWININPDEKFDLITTVVPMPFDAADNARYASKVARHARRMRRYLEELGLTRQPQRLRTQGRLIDRARLRAAVLHGDPRLLIARELRIKTDLFLGVIIDCSGSMQSGGNIEKAKLFGSLLAEAARGYRAIDLRLFGFTDKVIYDAGSAARCALHALRADGGNNDAAALWHVAQLARTSKRRAKLLVMISDGLPTECSAAALKALVGRLTRRWGMCCAQLAVQPLAEVCFPNYILLQEYDLDASVRRFGQVVGRLVKKAIQG
jgi:hypothetical protein